MLTLLAGSRINIEIERLRAVAVLMVVFDHLPALVHFGPLTPPFYGADPGIISAIGRFAGWTGVDLFFCISGYVISRRFVPVLEQGRAEGRARSFAAAFWIRRVFRIMPSALLWLAVMVTCSALYNQSGTFFALERNILSALPILGGVANLFAPHAGLLPNGVYWSLALEEQFYLAFPLFVLFVPASWRLRVLIALIALQCLPDRSSFDSLLWFTRLDAIMWGCLIASIAGSSRREPVALQLLLRNRFARIVVSGLLVAALGLLPLWLPPATRTLSLLALVSAALVFLASLERGYILPLPRPIPALLQWVGSRSYAIYLVHIPAFYLTYETLYRLLGRELSTGDRSLLMLAAIPLLIILVELNFRWVELPLRRKGVNLAARVAAARPQPMPAEPAAEAELGKERPVGR